MFKHMMWYPSPHSFQHFFPHGPQGCDHLFERHPEIIQRLSFDAPQLLPTLLDGLIWRSRTTINGQRRATSVKSCEGSSPFDFRRVLLREWFLSAGCSL